MSVPPAAALNRLALAAAVLAIVSSLGLFIAVDFPLLHTLIQTQEIKTAGLMHGLANQLVLVLGLIAGIASAILFVVSLLRGGWRFTWAHAVTLAALAPAAWILTRLIRLFVGL